MCVLAEAPSQPDIALVEVTSTAVTVTIMPSANNGDTSVTYTVFCHSPGFAEPDRKVQVVHVSQDITLSPLQPARRYAIFARAANSAGYRDSAVINVVPKPAGR